MGALFDVAKQIEPWLTERGLKGDEIANGMNLLLGDDWEKIGPPELFKRLQSKGYSVTETMPAFADELEGLVRGALKIESFRRVIYGLGTD
jgi:hypothetical protein